MGRKAIEACLGEAGEASLEAGAFVLPTAALSLASASYSSDLA